MTTCTNSESLKHNQASSVLKRITEQAFRNRLRVGEFFRDSDPLHRGECRQSAFKCSLTQLKIQLNTDDISALMIQYTDTLTGLVKYRQFLADLQLLESALLPAKNYMQLPQPIASRVGHETSMTEVLERIRVQVCANRVRLSDFFTDPLRKGYCTFSNVLSSFTLLGISLSASEIQQLHSTYGNTDGTFNYETFCRDVGER